MREDVEYYNAIIESESNKLADIQHTFDMEVRNNDFAKHLRKIFKKKFKTPKAKSDGDDDDGCVVCLQFFFYTNIPTVNNNDCRSRRFAFGIFVGRKRRRRYDIYRGRQRRIVDSDGSTCGVRRKRVAGRMRPEIVCADVRLEVATTRNRAVN